MVYFVLGASVALQVAAAILALLVMRTTERRLAWILISVAVGLMAMRRVITLARFLAGSELYPPDLAAELVALGISVLMVVGIALSAPLFRKFTRGQVQLRTWEHVVLQANWGVAISRPGQLVFETVNPAFARMHGYTVEEMVGMPIEAVHAALDRAEVERDAATLEVSGYVRRETEHLRRDGSTFPVSKAVSVVRDEQGKPLFYSAHVEDITERKRAEEEARERETRLRLLADQIPAVLWTTDRDLRFTSSMGSGLRQLGLVPGQLIGVSLFDYFQTNDPAFAPIAAQRRALEGESVRFETPWRERIYRSYVEPLRDETGAITGTIGIALDVTEHKRAENELRVSHARLRNLAARLQEVREEERTSIAREIHDELGQALTAIKLDLAWLRDHVPATPPDLRERAQGTVAYVETTLATARRLSGQLRPAILDQLGLEAALESLGREWAQRSGCECSLDVEADDLGLDAKRDTAVYRIVQEALTNVARHAAATRVEIRLRARPHELTVEVEDDGRGIRPEAVGAGDSFGLIGMRERAHALGGEVTIGSGDGGGTLVVLRLPLPIREVAETA